MHADLGHKLTTELTSFCSHSIHSEPQCMSKLLALLRKDELAPLGALTDETCETAKGKHF